MQQMYYVLVSLADVRYASVIETDDSHSTVTFDFERFKRDKVYTYIILILCIHCDEYLIMLLNLDKSVIW